MRESARGVLVVAPVLGEGFLDECAPEGTIVTSMTKEGIVSTTPCPSGHVVIDDNSVRNTERIELDSVDSFVVHSIVCVEENFLDAAFLLGEAGSSRLEPAVAECTLVDVGQLDAVRSEQCTVRESFLSSLPGNAVACPIVRFTHVFPG